MARGQADSPLAPLEYRELSNGMAPRLFQVQQQHTHRGSVICFLSNRYQHTATYLRSRNRATCENMAVGSELHVAQPCISSSRVQSVIGIPSPTLPCRHSTHHSGQMRMPMMKQAHCSPQPQQPSGLCCAPAVCSNVVSASRGRRSSRVECSQGRGCRQAAQLQSSLAAQLSHRPASWR